MAIIDKLLSLSASTHIANAPSVLHNAWWQIVKRDPARGEIYAHILYNDGHQNGFKKTGEKPISASSGPKSEQAEIELQIAVRQGPNNSCQARYQWRLLRSSGVALAREIMQFVFNEIAQTLAIVPTAYSETEAGSVSDRTARKNTSPLSLAVSRGTTWPTPQSYNEAVQNPAQCFADDALKLAMPELNVLGLPRPLSGAFATVYRMHTQTGQDWAVKCFTDRVTDQQIRYQAISNRLHHLQVPFFTEFEYQHPGIRIQGGNYPIVKMRWVEGQALNIFVVSNLGDRQRLSSVAQEFYDLVTFLEYLGIAHGDLQHGNILVNDGKLTLVDYDGMFVPELAGMTASEIGHRNYQHPKRTAIHFGNYLDFFSSWVIYVSLFAVSRDPSLWERLSAGDEALLFKQADFIDPMSSRAFAALTTHIDADVKNAAHFLMSLTTLEPESVPPFGAVFNKT